MGKLLNLLRDHKTRTMTVMYDASDKAFDKEFLNMLIFDLLDGRKLNITINRVDSSNIRYCHISGPSSKDMDEVYEKLKNYDI